MANKLPNELITKILSPGLDVPDVIFRDVSPRSPFFRLSHQPTSVVLLVCRRWMAAATPLLYRVIVLRSKAQVQALERTLRARKELGAFVKKLRVEGGFGAAMHIILTCCPNITDLSLSLGLRSSDSVTGLVKSLGAINPTCLVIVDPRETEASNTPLNQLVEKLNRCLESWTNLNEIHVSGMEGDIYRWQRISSTLIETKNLHTVTIPLPRCSEETVQRLKRCGSLGLIRIVDTGSISEIGSAELARRRALQNYVDSDPRLREIVKFEISPSPQFIPEIPIFDTNYIPLAWASDELYDFVWNHVLTFVFGIDLNKADTGDHNLFICSSNTHSKISTVSKTFHRLSLPYIYGFPTFFNDRSIRNYTSSILQNPSLGRHLRSLQALVSLNAYTNPVMLRECLHSIISKAPNLKYLRAVPAPVNHVFYAMFESRLPLTLDAFQDLAETAGPGMVSILDVEITAGSKESLCPSVLHQFPVLRSLRCEMMGMFDVNPDKIFPDSLPALESLQITSCMPSFLKLLSSLDLNSLQEFEIKRSEPTEVDAFLQIHGPKIQKLGISLMNNLPIFDRCPNMICLRIYFRPTTADVGHHLLQAKHTRLTKIIFDRCPNMTCLRIYFRPTTTDVGHHLLQAKHTRLTKIIFDRQGDIQCDPPATERPEYISSLKFSNFPALCEIQVPILDWPATEFEISRSGWPQCSELLALQNIKLTDGEGRGWRPRLKTCKAN